MNDCVFCKIASHEINDTAIFYEDNNVLVMLDADWAVKGHSLIIWKQHKLNASDLSQEEFLEFARIYHRAEQVLLKVTGKDRALVLKTGGLISHFHFHIYPVDSATEWQSIKDIFDKKVKYQTGPQEASDFIQSLRQAMRA
jgi:diadenosine tetraphosphate (Ap4A) HIT family hydrolase